MTELQKILTDRFYYYNGTLFNKIKPRTGYICQPIGTKHHRNRLVYHFLGRQEQVSRMVFAFHHGFMPEVVDHIDGNGMNNKIENLRSATKLQNQYNRKKQDNTFSKYKGVAKASWIKETSKKMTYVCNIRAGKKNYWLGTFDTEKEAALAYNEKAKELHGEFARLNIIE